MAAKDTPAGLVRAGPGIFVGLHIPGMIALDRCVASVREASSALGDVPEQHGP